MAAKPPGPEQRVAKFYGGDRVSQCIAPGSSTRAFFRSAAVGAVGLSGALRQPLVFDRLLWPLRDRPTTAAVAAVAFLVGWGWGWRLVGDVARTFATLALAPVSGPLN